MNVAYLELKTCTDNWLGQDGTHAISANVFQRSCQGRFIPMWFAITLSTLAQQIRQSKKSRLHSI